MIATDLKEGLKIVALTTIASVGYGIIHDQITVRICLEYFTVFHPDIFHTTDPTVLAFGWGIIATWWMGAILGVGLATAARYSNLPKLGWQSFLKPILIQLGGMSVGAVIAGLLGYRIKYYTPLLGAPLDGVPADRFYACLFAHNASYDLGALGALIIACWAIGARRSLPKPEPPPLSKPPTDSDEPPLQTDPQETT